MSITTELLDPPKLDTITVAGVTVPHNSRKWHVCTNRHPTAAGRAWGWIEGVGDQVCWSNDRGDGGFNSAAAGEMAAAHNQWLEDMKSQALKILESRERYVVLHRNYMRLQESANEALAKAQAERDVLNALENPTA